MFAGGYIYKGVGVFEYVFVVVVVIVKVHICLLFYGISCFLQHTD